MIFRWIFLLQFALALPATALAGSYRVIFGGAITAMDDGAPDSFSIGERVLGTFEFNTEPEWAYSLSGPSVSYKLVTPFSDDAILVASPFSGPSVFGTGHLQLSTESGFAATDIESEIITFLGALDSNLSQIGVGTIRNRMRYDGLPNTLHTSQGPIANRIHLFLKSFDLSPALVADDLGREGELRRVSHALFDPLSFPGIRQGSILFDQPLGNTGLLSAVRFDIDTLRIVAIPEPATMGLLLFAMIGAGAGRRTSR